MKVKISFTILLFFGLFSVAAQQTLITSGGNSSGGGGTVSFSVGQIVYKESLSAAGSLSQGVQQAYEITVVSSIIDHPIIQELNVYPNPTSDYLILNINDHNFSSLSLQLCDLCGNVIDKREVSSKNESICMDYLPSDVYLLHIIQNDKTVKTFKVIKK